MPARKYLIRNMIATCRQHIRQTRTSIRISAVMAVLASGWLVTGCDQLPIVLAESRVAELELIAAYPVENEPGLLEPSGLTLWDGRLFTVADKDDGTIFEVVIDPPVARLVPHLRFTPPQERRPMDWEGITVDPRGNFHLISEEHGRMFSIGPDFAGGWTTPDLRPYGRHLGLFAKHNAHFEGIAWLGPDHFLGAAEREPRGLVEWRKQGGEWQVSAWLMEDSPFLAELPLLRVPDYSGLYYDNGRLFALFRGASLVVELERTEDGFQEIAAWSYARYERESEWAYRNQVYGQAEGLVVNGDEVFIIWDNNRGGRIADPSDRRSLLLHMRIPKDKL